VQPPPSAIILQSINTMELVGPHEHDHTLRSANDRPHDRRQGSTSPANLPTSRSPPAIIFLNATSDAKLSITPNSSQPSKADHPLLHVHAPVANPLFLAQLKITLIAIAKEWDFDIDYFIMGNLWEALLFLVICDNIEGLELLVNAFCFLSSHDELISMAIYFS
jgi:hypothetical protein